MQHWNSNHDRRGADPRRLMDRVREVRKVRKMKVELSPLERFVIAERLRGEYLEDIAERASRKFDRHITRERIRQVCGVVAKRMQGKGVSP